jgi:tRNA A-37 threonylcarbamoyl transferase component Bud32/tetratricopeptide (TPR) repeat protein
MQPHPRYQIIEEIAQGDFAVVYRALDKELQREVAIKQIHQQYLNDPEQLERYWQEAQLLASLEHPNILTIFDIVRDRGWLILELMQGSLPSRLGGQPADLDYLRLTLIYSLHALHCLHEGGIIHGDIKPGNLLLDRNERVKIGDFGIARRVTGDDGSLLKGATKYMAPEVLSDQFGPVGPHSDLYSLGFTAYEIMCGDNFDSLFPGLDVFGRDRQVAWMMWHAAQDRRLPEINRVLEGVPPDLVTVIERLTEKDPNKRYRTAEQAVQDLRTMAQLGATSVKTPEEEAAEAAEAKAKKQKRLIAVGALAASLMLCTGVIISDLIGKKQPPVVAAKAEPTQGTLGTDPDLDRNEIVLVAADGSDTRITVSDERDEITLNGKKAVLADLKANDEITIRRYESIDGDGFQKIIASRPVAEKQNGTIAAINLVNYTFDVTSAESEKPLTIYVPDSAAILLNGRQKLGGNKITLNHLVVGDRVNVQYMHEGQRLDARRIESLRNVASHGTVLSLDTQNKAITVRIGEGENASKRRFPLADGCQLTLNGVPDIQGQLISLSHLLAGDQVKVIHDTQAKKIDAVRDLTAVGVLASSDGNRLVVKLRGVADPVAFTLAEGGAVVDLESGGPFSLATLRPGDKVTITHDSPNLDSPNASKVTVQPQTDPRIWAIVIGQQNYDDAKLSKLPHSAADAKLVYDTLLKKYRVPAAQNLAKREANRVDLTQSIPAFLADIPEGSQLVVYFVGHGYLTPSGKATLALKDFDSADMDRSGMLLSLLVKQMEQCSASEKLLLLDTCHDGDGPDLKNQPSPVVLAEAIKEGPNRPVSTSVTVIASCDRGQRGLTLRDATNGVFAIEAAAAFAGTADINGDYLVDSSELIDFLKSRTAEVKLGRKTQTPQRIMPDATPERLSRDARESIVKMLGHLSRRRIDYDELKEEFDELHLLAPKQPEPRLVYGLVLQEHNRTLDAQTMFEIVTLDHPNSPAAYFALALARFNGQRYEQGMKDLAQFVARLPPPDADQPDAFAARGYRWSGMLRQYAVKALAADVQPVKAIRSLEAAVKGRGKPAIDLFLEGMRSVDARISALDEEIRTADDDATRSRLRFKRKQTGYYVKLDIPTVVKFIKSRLDK